MKKLLIPGMLVALFAFACSKKDSSSPSPTTTGSTTSTTSTTSSNVMVADFTANKTMMDKGDTLRLTNASKNQTYNLWDFGDGGFDSKLNTTHVFTKRQVYHVKLTVEDASNKHDTSKMMDITVGHKQLIGFTVMKATPSNPSGIFITANPSSDVNNVTLTDTNKVASYPFTVKFLPAIDLNDNTTTTWNVKLLDNKGHVLESIPATVDLSKVFTSYIQMAPGSSTDDIRLNYNVVK